MPAPNQIARRRADMRVTADDLLRCPTGAITAEGLRNNVRVGIQYLAGWLAGHGRMPIDHSMEDLATAEIARSQVWQWLHHPRAVLADGRQVTETLVRQVMAGELDLLRERLGAAALDGGGYPRAAQLFAEIATREELDDFLTLRACDLLD
jgi:malate synthase